MKKLPITNIKLKDAVRLSSEHPHAIIWRHNLDQYVITVGKSHQPVYAFESFEFSVLLHATTGMIADFSLIRSKCLLCDGCHQFQELRILSDDGSAYSIDQDGDVVALKQLSLDEDQETISKTPMELWGLSGEFPYMCLRITDDLAEELVEHHILSFATVEEVVDRLWIDLKHTESQLNIHTPVDVIGEFLSYGALELKCGRIVLMTSQEKSEIMTD